MNAFVQFWNSNKSVLLPAIVSIATTLITLVISHNLDNAKLRYSVKMKITEKLTQEKYAGIVLIRKTILKLNSYEDLSVTEDELIPEYQNSSVFTPAVCYSYEMMIEYANELNDLSEKYKDCINHKCFARIILLRNFLIEYAKTCKNNGINDELLRWMSVPLYEEFSKMSKQLDSELIKAMNKPNLTYISHNGRKYQKTLNKETEKMKESELYRKSLGNDSILNGFLKDIEQSKEQPSKCLYTQNVRG